MMNAVTPYTRRYAGRVLAEPNTVPPIVDTVGAMAYGHTLRQLMPGVDVLVAVKMMRSTKPGDLRELIRSGLAAAVKLYPEGVTTHSGDGVPEAVLRKPDAHTWIGDQLDVMQKSGGVLQMHGEMPGQEDPLTREPDFFPFVEWVLTNFPRLRVSLEHITTDAAVKFVDEKASRGALIAGTITVHHLIIHLGHLLGSACSDGWQYGDGKLHPHLHCWPCAKRPGDRNQLIWAATSGRPWFFLGSDTAPHPKDAKEAACGCAGVFTAPVLPEALVQVFDDQNAIDRLPGFAANFGDRFYGKSPTSRTLRLVPQPWTVPELTAGVVPFLAGRMLRWSLES